MKKLFTNSLAKKITLASVIVIEFVLNLLAMLIKINVDGYTFNMLDFKSQLGVTEIKGSTSVYEPVFSIIVGVLFYSLIVVAILSIILLFVQKKDEKANSNDIFILLTINIVIVLLQLLFIKFADILSTTHLILFAIQLLLLLFAYIYLCIYIHFNEVGELKETKINNSNRVMNLVIATISLVFCLVVFFLPLYVVTTKDASGVTYLSRVSLLDGLFGLLTIKNGFSSDMGVILFIELCTFVVLFVINLAYYLAALKYFYFDYDTFYHKSHVSVIFSFVFSLIYFIVGIVPILTTADSFSLSFIPLVVMSFLVIAIYAFSARYEVKTEKTEKRMPKKKVIKRFEILFFTIAFAGVFIGSLFVDLVNINVQAISSYIGAITIRINCIDILQHFSTLGTGFRGVAFLLIISITIVSMLVVSSIALFISKSKLFHSVSFGAVVVEYFFMFALSLFGIYFVIVQNMSIEMVSSVLKTYGYELSSIDNIKISSSTYIFFLIDSGLLVILMFLKPFSTFNNNDEMDINIKSADLSSLQGTNPLPANGMPLANSENQNEENTSSQLATNDNLAIKEDKENKENKDNKEEKEETLKDFDACPAFSELDSLKPKFDEILATKKQSEFKDPTLVNIINFVVSYAANCRLHLSYTPEDIATFVAGLGMSRLTILQGMSGTGKTSLPKIFSEALMADCDIVEVESSWKDKNELLGYYNDFSKTFTPKKFTQALYEASLKPEVITFIVLDEMNLSRIEYYFSDFLSLMENEEDKREIKLLNVKLYNTYDGVKHSYLSLEDNHTLKIPTNVFFIGTANRDESTFEISDKVYDRANTINFDKRAKPVKNYLDPLTPEFLPYVDLKFLLEKAKKTYEFDLDGDERIKKVEELLAPYNISFGNRVYNQMENFVKVYCSCFNDPKSVESEALEKILFSKVVHKLEFKAIDDKDYLVHEFEKLGFYTCSEFIAKINGDL